MQAIATMSLGRVKYHTWFIVPKGRFYHYVFLTLFFAWSMPEYGLFMNIINIINMYDYYKILQGLESNQNLNIL